MFWDSMVVVGSKILSLEDMTTILSQNVGNQLPSDRASYPKRTYTYNDEFRRERIYKQEYRKGNEICDHTIQKILQSHKNRNLVIKTARDYSHILCLFV
jgi:hypothetical protein